MFVGLQAYTFMYFIIRIYRCTPHNPGPLVFLLEVVTSRRRAVNGVNQALTVEVTKVHSHHSAPISILKV